VTAPPIAETCLAPRLLVEMLPQSLLLPTSSFSFSVLIDFQREPIGLFTVRIGINPQLASKYFSGVDISSSITLDVNPALLNLDSSALSSNINL
jgi:hypothetical protein